MGGVGGWGVGGARVQGGFRACVGVPRGRVVGRGCERRRTGHSCEGVAGWEGCNVGAMCQQVGNRGSCWGLAGWEGGAMGGEGRGVSTGRGGPGGGEWLGLRAVCMRKVPFSQKGRAALGNVRIQGQTNPPGRDGHDVVTALGELDGQPAHDVAQAAGLGPGRHLGGDKHHVLGVGCGVGFVRAGAGLFVGVGPRAGCVRGWVRPTPKLVSVSGQGVASAATNTTLWGLAAGGG